MGDKFWQGGPVLAAKWSGGTSFSAKIGPAGPILGGTDFGVTCLLPTVVQNQEFLLVLAIVKRLNVLHY